MALVSCSECGKEISTEAESCPNCGRVNKKAVNDEQDSKQKVGCAVFILGIVITLFIPAVGVGVLLIGLLVTLLNTRFK